MEVLKHIFLYLVLYSAEQYQYLRNLDYYGKNSYTTSFTYLSAVIGS